MSRIYKAKYLIYGFLPYFNSSSDVVNNESKTVANTNTDEIQESGTDRIKRIFQLDEFNNVSPELNLILNAACMSMFVGGMYGGLLTSKGAYLDFMNNNQATVFKDHFEAKRRLHDSVTRSFAKGAFSWGWRLTIFTTSYISLSTMISAYRGDYGIFEHVVAGGLTGFMYKFHSGPRASVVGGGLGLVLGALAGLCTTGLMKLTGMTMNDIRYWQYKWRESKMELKNKAIARQLEEEKLVLLKDHEKQFSHFTLEDIDSKKN